MAKEKDINYALRAAYVPLIGNNISVGSTIVKALADGAQVGNRNMYILIQNTGSVPISPKCGVVTRSSVLFSIFCKGEEMDGTEIEDIAAQLLEIIEPHRNFTIPVNSNFYVRSQQVVSDSSIPVFRGDTTVPVYERHIIVEHDIVHNNR